MQKNNTRTSVEKMTIAAMLLAMQVILANVLQIPLMEKQYNFGFIPIAVAGALLGAPWAMVVGALGDFLGAHIFPQGAYFPGFTLTNLLVGLVCGLVLYRKKTNILRCILAVVISLAGLNLFLNSLWLSILYSSNGRSYWGWVVMRAPNYLIEVPANILLTFLTLQGLKKVKLPSSVTLQD